MLLTQSSFAYLRVGLFAALAMTLLPSCAVIIQEKDGAISAYGIANMTLEDGHLGAERFTVGGLLMTTAFMENQTLVSLGPSRISETRLVNHFSTSSACADFSSTDQSGPMPEVETEWKVRDHSFVSLTMKADTCSVGGTRSDIENLGLTVGRGPDDRPLVLLGYAEYAALWVNENSVVASNRSWSKY